MTLEDIAGDLFEKIAGRVHFYITVGKKPAIEIYLQDKEIIAEIKNPLLAIEFGIEHLLSGGTELGKNNMLEKIKKHGYKIKLKYKMIEMEI